MRSSTPCWWCRTNLMKLNGKLLYVDVHGRKVHKVCAENAKAELRRVTASPPDGMDAHGLTPRRPVDE